MMKYEIPSISVYSFMTECIATVNSGVAQAYVDEVQTIIGKMTSEQYKARSESLKSILKFDE